MQGSIEITAEVACEVQAAYRDALLIWTVTFGTRDFGDRYVARPHKTIRTGPQPLPVYLAADTLHELQAKLPPGLTRMTRDPSDPAVVVESWL